MVWVYELKIDLGTNLFYDPVCHVLISSGFGKCVVGSLH